MEYIKRLPDGTVKYMSEMDIFLEDGSNLYAEYLKNKDKDKEARE